jgi:hypothetical protein
VNLLVADFDDFKETCSGTDIGFLNLIGTIYDGGAGSSGDSVVVGFLGSSKCSDVVFDEDVLCEI